MKITEDLNRGVSEDTGAEVEGAEGATPTGEMSTGAAFAGTEGAEALIGQASVLVARPEPGQTVHISAEPGQTYVLDFDPSQARALVDGDNLILMFDDGSQIVFENLVNLAQLENAPGLQYAGQDIIALLQAQGVIPGVLEGFELITPEPGQIIIIQAALGQRFIINFDPAAAQVSVEGDSLVMTFANGSQIVIQGSGGLITEPGAPIFSIAGAEIEASTLFSLAIALNEGEVGPDATATLEVAAGTDEPLPSGGIGEGRFLDEPPLGLLDAQDVIPPVENEFRLIDPEPEDTTTGGVEMTTAPTAPLPPVAHDDTDMVLEGDGERQENRGFTSGNVLTGVDPDSDPSLQGNQVADSPGDTGPITVISFVHDGVTFDPATPVDGTTVFFNDGTVIEIETALGGIFTFNFATGDLGYLSPFNVSKAGGNDPVEVFTYTIENGDGLTDSANLSIIIKDAVPTAVDDTNSFDEAVQSLVTGNVLDGSGSAGNAADQFGWDGQGSPTITGVTFVSGSGSTVTFTVGSATVDGGDLVLTDSGGIWELRLDQTTGSFAFTLLNGTFPHTLGDEGTNTATLTFEYTIKDSDGSTSTASLIIDVIDDVPVAVDDGPVATSDNTAVTIDVLSDDAQGADGAAVTGVTQGSNGSVVNNNNGTVTYTPNAGFHGTDTFTYTITDGDGDTSTATVTVTVTDEVPAFVSAVGATVDEDDLPAGSDTTKESTTDSGSVTVDFFADGPGSIELTTAGLPILTSGGTTLTYTLSPDNQTLTAKAGADTIFTITITGFSVSGTETTFTYDVTLEGTIDHVTALGENTESITVSFVATDADGDTVSDSFDVSIVDDVPQAFDDGPVATSDNTAVTIGVLSDDAQGADGAAVTGVTQGSNGSVVNNNDGTVTYTPNPGFHGTDTFTYTITDGDGDTSTATLTIMVNDFPTANPDDPASNPLDTVVDEALGDQDGQGTVFTPVSVDGNVLTNDDFGNDGAGTPPITDVTYDGALGLATKTVDATKITFTATNWTLVVYTQDDAGDGKLAGDYVFTQTDEYDHLGGQAVNADGVFTYTISDGNWDTAVSDLTIRIVDDVPAAVADANSFDEAVESLVTGNVLNGSGSAGNAPDDFGADDANTLAVTDVTFVSGSGSTVTFTVGSATVDGGDLVLTDSGGIWELRLNQTTGSYTFTLLMGAFPHTFGNDGKDTATLTFEYTIEDGDGDTSTASLTIDVVDDVPVNIVPEATVLANSATGSATGLLDFFGNIGVDLDGSVVFSGGTDGDTLTDTLGTPLTSNGDAITLSGFGTGTLTATADLGGANERVVFTITLNPDGTVATSDTYTVEMKGSIDNGGGLIFEDFSDAPAGRSKWIGIDDPRTGTALDLNQDLVFTGGDPTTDTVNTSNFGVGTNKQSVGVNETLRLDFVTNVDLTGNTKNINGLVFDTHYVIGEGSFTIIQTGGSTTNTVDALIAVYDANDDLDFTNDPLDSIIVSQVKVKDALGFDVTGSVTIVDNLDGTVTVQGLLEGYQVFVSTADGFSRMEITNVTAGGQGNDSFDLGGFELTSVDAGDPIDMSFDLTVEDADGDQSTGTIGVTLLPEITGTNGNDTLIGSGDDEVLVGGLSDDSLTGGPGVDTFVFSLAANEGNDTITDFVRTADIVSFTGVVDFDTDGDFDIADLNDAIASVSDAGAGNDVTVNFDNGAAITFMGVGTGSISSITELVDDPSQVLVAG